MVEIPIPAGGYNILVSYNIHTSSCSCREGKKTSRIKMRASTSTEGRRTSTLEPVANQSAHNTKNYCRITIYLYRKVYLQITVGPQYSTQF